MKTPRHLASSLALAGAFACTLAVPTASPARTVYDAGAALRANSTAETSAYANPYTDENGGVWSYMLTSKASLANTVTFKTSSNYTYGSGKLAGFAVDTTKQAQAIRVNIGADITTSAGTTLKSGELYMFPGNSDSQCACVTFTAPQDGWYSAFVSATDLAKNPRQVRA